MPNLIFKIEEQSAWQDATAAGIYTGAPVDAADGFIHFSGAQQVRETLTKHFAGRTNLLLVAVDGDRLGPTLKWERSRGGALFPHLYANLTMDGVVDVRPIPDTHDLSTFADWGIE
jgi:uncharacterized protein (DUF952 family)